jgi:hypothetical protein
LIHQRDRGAGDGRGPLGTEEDRLEGTSSVGRLNLAIRAFVVLGLFLRLAAYLLDYPLWWDEAFVAVNFLRRGFFDLLRPLDYGQVCPLLFLWAELASVRLLGFSEWSLRLFPLACALASVVLFRAASAQLLKGRALLLAVAVFAVAVHPIRHAADVKPYASDLLVALVLLSLAMAWWREPVRAGRLWWLAAFAPIALLLSHPAVFVVGGIGLALVVPAWSTRDGNVRAAMIAYGLVAIATCAANYALFARSQASAASPGMLVMWANSFPPLDSPVGLARWLAVAHSGDMLAYPCGGERGASSLSLLACVVGSVVLWRGHRRAILGCLLLPLLLAMVAAGLRLYPYGGPAPHGSSARIMQYAAPALCLLIGLGASRMVEWIRPGAVRDRLCRLGCWGLVVVGFAPLVAGLAHPYRSYHAEASRQFARRFWPEIGRGAEVACLRWDCGAAEWDSIQLGIAVSLCNQAIFSPSRRSGGPRLEAVSGRRPLRCVLGVAPESDSPKLVAWLDSMSPRFELRGRRSIPVDTAEPGRRPNLERYEVFEFVPKSSTPRSTRVPRSP